MKSELKNVIYLDYAATTPVSDAVLAAMQPYFQSAFGNPSSIHRQGQAAENAIEAARGTMAKVFGVTPGEVVFTSCGSESDNLALRGAALAARRDRNASHLLISPVEHPAVTKTAEQLADVFGFDLEILPVDEYGRVNPADVAARLRPETAVVSVIAGNNEIGTINPLAEIGAICRAAGVPFHSDAVQAAAYLSFDLSKMPVDLLSVGAHKLYGPKGVGALIVRAGTPVLPVQTGGGQEHSLRAGTSNTPYLVGQAEAFRLAAAERETRTARVLEMRDHLIRTVLAGVPDSRLTGHPNERLPNHASFVFQGVDGNELLMILDAAGFACSSGSACKTGNPEPSSVIMALGLPADWALGSLRLTLSHQTDDEELESFLDFLPTAVSRVRELRHA